MGNSFLKTFILSLALHLCLLPLTWQEHHRSPPQKKKNIQVVRLQLVPKKKLFKDKMKKQIVNDDNTGKEEKPQKSKFLGKKNQKYDRETVAKKIGSFKKAGQGKKRVPKKTKKIVKVKKRKTRIKRKISLQDIGLSPDKYLPPKKVAVIAGRRYGDRKSRGVAQSSDFVEDLPLGDATNLNTVEYKYFGFYDRIRKKLEQYWGKSLRNRAEILYKSGRSLASNENFVTSLLITLDSGGNIINVILKSSSGIKELDSAAIDSFNSAGPFPNPPRGMLKNGHAEIKWGFVVKS